MAKETIGSRIKAAREALGKSQAWLAEAIGVSQPTVFEWEADESQPKRHRVKTIAKALRKLPEWIERGSVQAGGKYDDLSVEVPIIGAVQAGAWMEAYQLPEGEWTVMRLPSDARYPGIPRFGLRNVGPSMNQVCKDGGIWVFVRYEDTGESPEAGHYVIAERVRKGGLVEATCKQLRTDGSGKLWLWPDSDDPRYQTPLPLDGDRETEEIRVIGHVIKAVDDL